MLFLLTEKRTASQEIKNKMKKAASDHPLQIYPPMSSHLKICSLLPDLHPGKFFLLELLQSEILPLNRRLPPPENPVCLHGHVENVGKRAVTASCHMLRSLYIISPKIDVVVAVSDNGFPVMPVGRIQLGLRLDHKHARDTSGTYGRNHPWKIINADVGRKIIEDESHIDGQPMIWLVVRERTQLIHRLRKENIRKRVVRAVSVRNNDEQRAFLLAD